MKEILKALGIDHKYFNFIISLLCLGLIALSIRFEVVGNAGLISTMATVAVNVGSFLLLSFGLQFFLGGIGRDFITEIFDEGNSAAAIYIGALFLALALLIKG